MIKILIFPQGISSCSDNTRFVFSKERKMLSTHERKMRPFSFNLILFEVLSKRETPSSCSNFFMELETAEGGVMKNAAVCEKFSLFAAC